MTNVSLVRLTFCQQCSSTPVYLCKLNCLLKLFPVIFKKTLLLLLPVIHSGIRIIINKPTSSDRGEGIALNHKSTIDVSRREDNF